MAENTMENAAVALTPNEADALIRLVLYAKFETRDADSLLFAGSPFVNSALEKLLHSHPLYGGAAFSGRPLPEQYGKLLADKLAGAVFAPPDEAAWAVLAFPYQP
ncbi:TPA: hypothetical protein ACFNMI_002001 [Neisseria bacilliformis]